MTLSKKPVIYRCTRVRKFEDLRVDAPGKRTVHISFWLAAWRTEKPTNDGSRPGLITLSFAMARPFMGTRRLICRALVRRRVQRGRLEDVRECEETQAGPASKPRRGDMRQPSCPCVFVFPFVPFCRCGFKYRMKDCDNVLLRWKEIRV